MDRCQIAIVGSGFAGSLLARVLATLGYDVVLLERGRHPRFAIGESSTPLGNLALERLARRYSLPDLQQLAAHGRWLRTFPELRRGLKRGFSFYQHRPGRPYANDAANDARLLVAASPSDEVADSHWLREDVDHHFVRQAIAAGVDYRDQVELASVAIGEREVQLRGHRDGAPVQILARMVIDASGPAGFLKHQLGIPSALRRTATRSALVFGHFQGVALFDEVAREAGAQLSPPPYPEDWAALHHLIDGGWMYLLRFDHDVASAGFLLSPQALARVHRGGAIRPDLLWDRLLARYPSIGAQFAPSTPLFPVRFQARVQHRMATAAGPRWAALPHTFAFVDPLFSTGIAWSLLGVERLARAFEAAASKGRGRLPPASVFTRYASLLAREADQVDRLIHGAYLALGDFDLFASHAMLYFAAVSYAEARQRLIAGDDDAWTGFLGVDDPSLSDVFGDSVSRLRRLTHGGQRRARAAERQEYLRWVAGAIAPRNIAGLADPARHNLYPVDFALLVERCRLLGLDRETITAALPRLRGVA